MSATASTMRRRAAADSARARTGATGSTPGAGAPGSRLENGPRSSAGLDEVCFAVARAYYNYLGLLERTLEQTGLGRRVRPGMGHVLFALFERDDRVIRELVERTRLAYPTLSNILAGMAKGGLVECRPDADDGRAVRVRLTRLGRSLEPRCRDVVARINAVMLGELRPAEIQSVHALLERMTESMRRAGQAAVAAAHKNGRTR